MLEAWCAVRVHREEGLALYEEPLSDSKPVVCVEEIPPVEYI
jgi:hypothetical protein